MIRTRLCSLSRQNKMAFPTSLRFWKHTVFSSAYSTMSFSWWWKNSRIPETHTRPCYLPHSRSLMSLKQSSVRIQALFSTYQENHTHGEEVCKSWASPPSESSRTAVWSPEAAQPRTKTETTGFSLTFWIFHVPALRSRLLHTVPPSSSPGS